MMRMAGTAPHRQEIMLWQDNYLALSQLSSSHASQPTDSSVGNHDLCNNWPIVAAARLDNRTSLIESLSAYTSIHQQSNNRELIFAAHQHWGESCVQHLQGSFIFAIWDSRKQQLFCARDPMGTYPFYYYWHEAKFAFANDIARIVHLPNVTLTPNPHWIVEHLCNIWLENENSFYNEIYRLPPAHTLTVSNEGLYTKQYWEFDLGAETILKSDAEYIEAAREQLVSAIKRRLVPPHPIGLELSGGLDATSIAAVAYAERAEHASLQLSTYSHASPVGMAGQQSFRTDEREHIDLLRDSIGIDASYFFTNEQATILPMVQKAIQIGGGVARCDFSMLTSGIHQMAAEQGVQVMLSGFGGDQLVSSRPQTSRYYLREGLWQQLWQELNSNYAHSHLHPLKQLFKLLLSEYMPLEQFGLHHSKQNARQRKRRIETIEQVLHTSPQLCAYIADVDWRERLEDWWETERRLPKSLREAQARAVSHPQLTNRLEATSLIAATVGIEYRYPLLDVQLLSFFLSVPPDQKRRNGYGRYLFRCCTAGLLPDPIRWAKKTQGSMYPWYVHSLRNELAGDIPDVSDNAPEEVKVSRLIAQAQREVQRRHLQE
ncbi:MAG: asparagine synthase-related protein [Chloroflexota bacterium]